MQNRCSTKEFITFLGQKFSSACDSCRDYCDMLQKLNGSSLKELQNQSKGPLLIKGLSNCVTCFLVIVMLWMKLSGTDRVFLLNSLKTMLWIIAVLSQNSLVLLYYFILPTPTFTLFFLTWNRNRQEFFFLLAPSHFSIRGLLFFFYNYKAL